MAEPKKAKAPIMDVAHPGKTAPSPNSKSVIVTHRPMVADPMVVADKSDEDTPEESPAVASAPKGSSGAPKLQPLASSDTTPEVPEIAKSDAVADEPEPEAPAIPPKIEVKEVAPAPIPESVGAPEAGTSDSLPEEPKAPVDPALPADPAAVEVAEQAEHDAVIEKLVNDKVYFLPIKTLEQRRTKRTVIFGVAISVVLLVAWADVALDAGLIKIPGVKPVTHFLSN